MGNSWVAKNLSHGPWNRGPFVLDEIGDASVRDTAAVVAFRCSNNENRVIVKSFEPSRMVEVRLPEGELDHTIHSFCEWVDAQNAGTWARALLAAGRSRSRWCDGPLARPSGMGGVVILMPAGESPSLRLAAIRAESCRDVKRRT